MLFFAYHKRSRPTGKRVAKAMGFVHHGVEIPACDFLVRWGTSQRPERDKAGRVLNSAQSINRAGDKLRALRTLQEAGVRVPEFGVQPDPAWDRYLGRKLRGFGGKDIIVLPTGMGDTHSSGVDFYTKFIPNDREYRIHVCGGKVIRVVRKYLERPDQKKSEYVKNHANGYVFKTPAKHLNQTRTDAAVKAVEALGLDFGAVDMVVDHQGLEYVLEVNTAPACSPKTMQAYAFELADMVKATSKEDYILHPQVSPGQLDAMVHEEV